jgi:ABC-type uncharacterized transport system ATPase subunit
MAGTGKAHLRDGDAVLRVEDLVVEFPIGRRGTVSAVAGISFDVLRGETLGIVGESPEQIEAHEKSGVDEFIHIRADALEVLAKIHTKLGIS